MQALPLGHGGKFASSCSENFLYQKYSMEALSYGFVFCNLMQCQFWIPQNLDLKIITIIWTLIKFTIEYKTASLPYNILSFCVCLSILMQHNRQKKVFKWNVVKIENAVSLYLTIIFSKIFSWWVLIEMMYIFVSTPDLSSCTGLWIFRNNYLLLQKEAISAIHDNRKFIYLIWKDLEVWTELNISAPITAFLWQKGFL